MLSGLPAHLLWRLLATPLMEMAPRALRLGGAMLLVAGTYQLTPVKQASLRHYRSPMSQFLRMRGSLESPSGAMRAGLLHAAYCTGCCAALMVVLVGAAAMSPWWAAVVAAAVFIERNVRWGVTFSKARGIALVVSGSAVLVHPPLLSYLT